MFICRSKLWFWKFRVGIMKAWKKFWKINLIDFNNFILQIFIAFLIYKVIGVHRGSRGESLPLRSLGGGATPPFEPNVRHPPRKNCNRKTHKNGIYTTIFRPFWRKHPPSDPKNIDTLPSPRPVQPPSGTDRAPVSRLN